MGGDLGERALLGHPAVFDDEELVGQGGRFDGVVGDQEARSGVAAQLLAQEAAQLGSGRGVDGGERFVEEEQRRFGGQGPGQGHPLGLAAGELAGAGGGDVGESDALEPLHRPPPGFGPGDVTGP